MQTHGPCLHLRVGGEGLLLSGTLASRQELAGGMTLALPRAPSQMSLTGPAAGGLE